jgi:hypothetical protein
MKFPLLKRRKAKEKPEQAEERSKIADRLSRVKQGASNPCDEHDVKKLVQGLAKGDG